MKQIIPQLSTPSLLYNRKHRTLAFIFCIALLSSGCTYDENTEFYVETKISFFLYSIPASQTRTLLTIEDHTLIYDWHRPLGINNQALGDIHGKGEFLWITDLVNRRILKVIPQDQRIEERYHIEEITPYCLSIGEKYIAVTDPSQQSVVFIDLKKKDRYVRKLEGVGGQMVYKSNKFYIQTGNNKISIFNEQALAQTRLLEISGIILDIQSDKEKYIAVYSTQGSDLLHESRIDYNIDEFTQKERETNFTKIQLSPYSVANFGKEYLEDLGLSAQNQLPKLGIKQIESFEADFFESYLYFQRSDSLFRHQIRDQNTLFIGKMAGKMLDSWFYQDFIGK